MPTKASAWPLSGRSSRSAIRGRLCRWSSSKRRDGPPAESGRSSLAVERAASAALDALCGPTAIEALEGGIRHDEFDIRDIVVRRLSRIGVPAIAPPLESVLADEEPVIRRNAARGLADIDWRPTSNEKGALYWAALREWHRCAECGAAAIPILVEAYETANSGARQEIVAGLSGLGWEPEGQSALALSVLAARGRWEKVVEAGDAGIGPLTSSMKEAAHWRDRLAAAKALEALGREPEAPFGHIGLAALALGILDLPSGGDSATTDRKAAMEDFAAEKGLARSEDGDTLELCECGYPVSRLIRPAFATR